jgi:hypothetical protein
MVRAMSHQGVPTGRSELEARVVARAQSSPEFRELLLADPRAALAQELGVDLPERLEVQVVQERPDALCIVLPVDLSGMGRDAVWAMTGRRPAAPAPPPAARP